MPPHRAACVFLIREAHVAANASIAPRSRDRISSPIDSFTLSAAVAAATVGAGSDVENIALLAELTSTRFIAREHVTNPPCEPIALLSVPTETSTSATETTSASAMDSRPTEGEPRSIDAAPLPRRPHTSVACASSTHRSTRALPHRAFSARFNATISLRGAKSPSMLNSESVTIITRFAVDARTISDSCVASRWRYTVTFAPPRLAARAHPSTMDAWFSSSEKISQPRSSQSAGMTPQFAAYPDENRTHSSVALSFARDRSRRECAGV
mmetsp:Transcript_3720/g.16327  ORF Transcript_3720/g.16327 Transcript_3720/m.16327 type:complete len:269 (+) Transcript_3720:311-1117(+)